MQRLERLGIPNRFGPQRFGTRHTNHHIGRSILLGTNQKRLTKSKRRFYLNALQSAIFNAVLDIRLADETLTTLLPGDLAWKHDSGSVFPVDQALSTDPQTLRRLEQIEISPSGPMWGCTMTRASGRTEQIELEALGGFGLSPDQFIESPSAKLVPGVRRPLRVPMIDAEVEGGCDEFGGYVRLAFDLPAGAYATAVLREIMKTEIPKNRP
ncbi:MAG TPA: tRNA pseudouridine(13) synthase TruD [Phycisphaerales bacterium]|nr:tRNA pseudouridine(13) synthase TruD [Phycisphaerales bacterium]